MKILECKKCGNVIEIVKGDNKNVTCCGDLMKEVVPNTVDAAKEKHLPICNINDDVVFVSVGEVAHPMEDAHYIEYIIAEYKDSVVKYKLNPGEEPEALFDYEKGMKVYAICNLHGLWMKEL